MKKTSTLKNALIPESLKVNPEFNVDNFHQPDLEPDAQTITNILNYSKALRIQPSVLLDHVITINN